MIYESAHRHADRRIGEVQLGKKQLVVTPAIRKSMKARKKEGGPTGVGETGAGTGGGGQEGESMVKGEIEKSKRIMEKGALAGLRPATMV